MRAQRVQFLGRVDEALLARLYEEADIFVAPSTYESFGLVFTEAMSCALPCVGTNIGGIREVLGDDNARYLIAPGDTNALIEALSRLVADPDERGRIGALNHRRWEQLFSAAAMVRRTEAFFLRVAASLKTQGMQTDDGIERSSGRTNVIYTANTANDTTPIPTATHKEHAYATREEL
jgi:glycosyltransferase involved in cell wall biosynthesis